jgi:nucleoside-diphosphate kinase
MSFNTPAHPSCPDNASVQATERIPAVTERTLVLIKPDGVARGLIGEVIGRIERKGFAIVALELRTVSAAIAEEHYGEHRDKPFFGELVEFITSGPLVAAVIEGPEAIVSWRAMMGATNPVNAAPGTIRGDLATQTQFNVTHGSDSPESAAREIALFFPGLSS